MRRGVGYDEAVRLLEQNDGFLAFYGEKSAKIRNIRVIRVLFPIHSDNDIHLSFLCFYND